jgi:hypothetical protein
MLEYTHSLEAALDTTQEHAASLTTAQNQLLQKLDRQQQELLTQTSKFMTLLNIKAPTPAPPTTNVRQQPTRTARTRRNPNFPRHCNSCNKDAVHHEDDDCYTLEKNKDKRPHWYVARK